MKVAALIEQYNTERPNNIEDSMKMSWLRKLEMLIIEEVINTHEHDEADNSELGLKVSGSTLYITPGGSLADHIASFNMDSTLLIPEEYDDVYMYYLDQRIALDQNDTRRYNTAATAYNNAMLVYQQYYNRTHMPLKKRNHLIDHRNI